MILQRNNLYLLKYIRLVLFMFIILRYDCTLLFYNWPIACPHFSSISKIPYRGSVLDGSVTGGNLEWLLLGTHSLSRYFAWPHAPNASKHVAMFLAPRKDIIKLSTAPETMLAIYTNASSASRACKSDRSRIAYHNIPLAPLSSLLAKQK